MGFSGSIPIPDTMCAKLNAVYLLSVSGSVAGRQPVYLLSIS